MNEHVRNADPETSKQAAKGKHDSKAASLVLEALQHAAGTPLIDEEIFDSVYTRHPMYAPSPDRLRHGRKQLEKEGFVITDGTKKTKRGCHSLAWKIKP